MNVRFIQDGDHVLMLQGGTLIARMPWSVALAVGRAATGVGKAAEEWACADSVADDQAMIIRAGVPVRIVNDPRVLDEAYHRAQWGDLRGQMPAPSDDAARRARQVVRVGAGVPSRAAMGRIGG